jgi:hypothetical protein
VKTDVGLGQVGHVGLAVEHHQFVAGMAGVVAGDGGLVVLEAEGEALVGQHAADEVELGLAVLG